MRIEQVAAKQDQQLTLQEAEVARVKSKEMRAAVTAHVIARAARTGRGLLPVYGLTLEELSNAPPAAVSLWVVEATADGDAVDDTGGGGRADKPKVMQASGADAIKELLLPRPASVPGARVVIGAVSALSCAAVSHKMLYHYGRLPPHSSFRLVWGRPSCSTPSPLVTLTLTPNPPAGCHWQCST